MKKTILIATAILVVGLAAGVAGRQALAPVKSPAAGAAPANHGPAGTTPTATDAAHGAGTAPVTTADHHDPAAGAGSHAGATGADPAHGGTDAHGGDAASSGATTATDSHADAGNPGGNRSSGGTSDYAMLSQIIGKMTPAESATLLKHLDDNQAIALLQSMPLRQINAILAELPTGRSQRIKTRLFGSAGHP
jgi:hypothetical protein